MYYSPDLFVMFFSVKSKENEFYDDVAVVDSKKILQSYFCL